MNGSEVQYYMRLQSENQNYMITMECTSALCPLWFNGILEEKKYSHGRKADSHNIYPFYIFSHLGNSFVSFDRHFSPDEVLQLLDRFYNLDMLKSDDEEMEILNQEEDFTLPQSFFTKEE
ncbi:Chromatin modification-related protein EAF7 [Macleaya cordata]|uniref:Chromatin modification-related protein EAF7 n=1 Tax=Macleaya cordata TaxID=56857 RepID=A0A200PRG9_MACCD|nr:Chromatin modification-related protein EAF7 [Macleaya cordata]